MSPTLFKYIFKDLFRIFMLTAGALSGIMSFGGMLKPLYEVGLDISQVGKILSYSGPAMMAYSLPIAALFATTIVYGRLGADNELTACRAAGISHLWMTFPAFVLGIATAFIAVVMLCFVVPASMLKVEKIVYSNLAQFVAGQIERKHQIRLEQGNKQVNVFAKSAKVHPFDPTRPDEQAVTLIGPVIAVYLPGEKAKIPTPEEFYMADEATAFIRQSGNDDVTLQANLVGGTKFPRSFTGAAKQTAQLSIGQQGFGGKLTSPVHETTKFMDIARLRKILDHPEESRVISSRLHDFIRQDQQRQYLKDLADALNGPDHQAVLEDAVSRYVLYRSGAAAEIRDDKLFLDGAVDLRVRVVELRNGTPVTTVEAAEVRVKATADTDQKQLSIELEMFNCVLKIDGAAVPRGNLQRLLTVAMPPSVDSLSTRPAGAYVSGRITNFDQEDLNRNLVKLRNSVISEIHARMSFAVSCFILVMVGCALGMMFRSGNFLSAFAVSIVPALLSIALIVTGQHTSENVPAIIKAGWSNPRDIGLLIIWSGNAVVLMICAVLLAKLQRE